MSTPEICPHCGAPEDEDHDTPIYTCSSYWNAAGEIERGNACLCAENEKLTRINKNSCEDWAHDDDEIKRLAVSVGIKGESDDGYFRGIIEVVTDMANEIKALRQKLADAELHLASIGEIAVVDWDSATVGKVDAVVKDSTKYSDQLRHLFQTVPNERNDARKKLAESEARERRLAEALEEIAHCDDRYFGGEDYGPEMAKRFMRAITIAQKALAEGKEGRP